MKALILFPLSLLILSGCATSYDLEMREARANYKIECETWEKEHGSKLFIRKPGEENMMLQDVMARRCKEDQKNCTPPKVSKELRHLEYMWGVSNPTPESCN